jgi:hypothetical protein
MQNNQPVESQGNQQIKQKPITRKIIIAFASSIFLSLMLAPLVGRLYSWAFKVHCSSGFFLIPGDPHCSWDGFFFSYSFLLSLALVLSQVKNKIIIISWLIGTSLLILILIGEWVYLFSFILVGILGYLLGKLILRFKKQ